MTMRERRSRANRSHVVLTIRVSASNVEVLMRNKRETEGLLAKAVKAELKRLK